MATAHGKPDRTDPHLMRWEGPRPTPWTLTRSSVGLALTLDGVTHQGSELHGRLEVRRRWFRRRIHVDLPDATAALGPLPKRAAIAVAAAIREVEARAGVVDDLRTISAWHQRVHTVLTAAIADGRWISEESIVALEQARPHLNEARLTADPMPPSLRDVLTDDEVFSVRMFLEPLRPQVGSINESIVSSEQVDQAAFFAGIESSPLTEEQSRSVICFDNRVQVVASAGSGKTSVMVARAAYAIHKGWVEPSRILLLAFNRDAADELQERVDARLAAVGLPTDGVRASTFHSFGLSVIGRATGRKPRVAPWLEAGGDVRMVETIVDELRDSSPAFRFTWDIFRRLYGPLGEHEVDDTVDAWNPDDRTTGYRTIDGQVVKSMGERLIADWLYLNHVDYQYEKPYEIDVATSDHSQYRPDFFYPGPGVYHEHWAVGPDNRVPDEFQGYEESMRWKKNLHRQHGTTLLETTWGEIQDPAALSRLARDLEDLGVTLNWDPDREGKGPRPLRHEDLARLVRTFMAHVKSNGLTREGLEAKLAASRPGLRRPRTNVFLTLYWQIHDEWQRRLRVADEVDFEDMLLLAAEHLEAGRAAQDYGLVLVDEFQDASQARARLVAALVDRPGTHLLAVGDDWQAINRFAGADISVMSNFSTWFGPSQSLRLETTFRCSAEICSTSSQFISKNLAQLRKKVRAAKGPAGSPVEIVAVPSKDGLSSAVRTKLKQLDDAVSDGELRPARGERLSVFILGRYRFDKDLVPKVPLRHVDVQFKTIHKSKGLEADHVMVPNLTRGTYGFPSTIADDPVLELAMPTPETFEHAEERRLFYVALTRARQGVTLFAVNGLESAFVTELIEDGGVTVDSSAIPTPVQVCPACSKGTLVDRTGQYGPFVGCSNFPRCDYTARSRTARPTPYPPF